MAISPLDRIPTINDRVPTAGNRVMYNVNNGSFVWEIDVIGTHFPSLSVVATVSAVLSLVSTESNSITIDYADGTPPKTYDFVSNNGMYRKRFIRINPTQIVGNPTPENISGNAIYDEKLHFYADLPLPTGTVDDSYNHHRIIKISIEKFYALDSFVFNWSGIYGAIPSILNRLISLTTLSIEGAEHFTGIDSSFSRVFCENLTLGRLGFSFGNAILQFILNSSSLVNINLNLMFDFTGQDPVTSRLYDLLENPLLLPNLNGFTLSNTNIDFQLPNFRKDFTDTITLRSMPVGFKFSPDVSTWKPFRLNIGGSSFDYTEYKRLLESGGVVALDMPWAAMGFDFDLAINNTTCTQVNLGNQNFANKLPAFLSKLTVLSTLNWNNYFSMTTSTDISDWGVAGISISVQKIVINREINLPPVLPLWFSTLVNLTNLTLDGYNTQTRIDDHVDSFYAMASGTTDFDGLNYTLYGSDTNNNSTRPSGIYQAGTASTPMEKIWDLVNNHNMIITVTNATNDGKDIYTP